MASRRDGDTSWFRPSGSETVIVPNELRDVFDDAEEIVRRYFANSFADPATGRIEIGGERYVLVRASALSTDFLDTIAQLYDDRDLDEARAIGRAYLFDIAHTIGKNDARNFHRKMGLTDPLSQLSAGPVHFAYSGWAQVKLNPKSTPSPDDDYLLIYDHPNSFEADSWLRAGRHSDGPVCIMNAGYSSGWSEESFGIPLTAVEYACKAAGDPSCSFVMAPPHRIEERLRQVRPDLLASASSISIPAYFERKREEDALRRNERRLRSILEATPMPVLITGEDGTPVYGNAHAEDVFGVDPRGRSGQSPVALFEDPEVLPALFDAVKRGERIHGIEYRMLRAGGEPFSALVSCHPIVLPDGERGMVVSALDVTDYKRAEAALRVNERMATIGTLAAGVAHEIHNPISYVITNLERVLGQLESDAASLPAASRALIEPLAGALEGATRVREIARDLRALSRESDGRRDESVDVEEVLDRAVAVASVEWKHRARMARDYCGLPPIRGNSGRLGQVFINILVNAAQAISEGAAQENEIRVSTRLAGDRLEVTVEDSGRGIPADDLSRIFEPFFTTKDPNQGVGLGLAIAKNITEELGGTITIDSTPGAGTRVRVSLPLVAPPPAADEPADLVDLAGRRVLVVDDELRLADIYAEMLEDCQVVVAGSGREAAEKLAAADFDIVLCDLLMPDVSGMELYESCSESQRRRMIFMTGGAFSSQAEGFLDAIENPCLEKPLGVAELRRAIGAHLARLAAPSGD